MVSISKAGSLVPLYQLKITLRSSRPPIWRRVGVRADMPLSSLHAVIQIAMGWTDSHLHQFILGRTFYGEPDPSSFSDEMLNEKRHTVRDLAPEAKQKFIYEYDFGDSWMHEVKVEKILSPDLSFKHPVCLAGEHSCPPEDCGGLWGYYNLLDALANPKHPEHTAMKEWIGEDFQPEPFDLAATNGSLQRRKV